MVEITVYDFWDRRHYNILFAFFHGLFTLGGPTTMSQRQSSPMEQDMCQGTELMSKARKMYLPTIMWVLTFYKQPHESVILEEESWAPIKPLDFCSPSQYHIMREAELDNSAKPLSNSSPTKTVRFINFITLSYCFEVFCSSVTDS